MNSPNQILGIVSPWRNLIAQWNAHSRSLFKLSFQSISDASVFLTTEKSEVSSANNLGFETKLLDKLLTYIKNNSGLEIEHWELQLRP